MKLEESGIGLAADNSAERAFAWVERLTGGKIVGRTLQQRWRPHWFLNVEVGGTTLKLLLRGRRDEGLDSLEGATQRIEMEAHVVRALAAAGAKTPGYFGFEPDGGWLLMAWMPGDDKLTDIPEHAQRDRIYRNYIEAVKFVHDLDPTTLGLPDNFPRSVTSIGQSFDSTYATELRRYREEKGDYPQPVVELGLWWARNHVPAAHGEDRLCLGDIGANQFLFAGDRVSSLFDFELARFGDPLIDIGNIRYREMYYPIGGIEKHIRYYEQLCGAPLDASRLQFHTMMSALYTRLGFVSRMRRFDVWPVDQVAIQSFDTLGQRAIIEVMLDAYGIAPTEVGVPRPHGGDMQRYHDLLVAQLEGPIRQRLPETGDNRFRLNSAIASARVLALHNAYGRQFEHDTIDEFGRFLGSRPSSVEAGLEAIEAIIRDDPTPRLGELLTVLHRYRLREEHVRSPLQEAMGFAALVPLPRWGAIESLPAA